MITWLRTLFMPPEPSRAQPQRGVVVYLSGPISGMLHQNRPAFERACASLRASGYRVINPFEVFTEPPPADMTPEQKRAYWRRAMRADVRALMDADVIAMLPGWQRSEGARWEHDIATRMLGMRAIFITELREVYR